MDKTIENLVSPTLTVKDAIARIEHIAARMRTLLVVDDSNRLLGSVTDGDIRRAIIQGISLDAAVSEIMFSSPRAMGLDADPEDILAKMEALDLNVIPILDDRGLVVRVYSLSDFRQKEIRSNQVVVMAGGFGSRLHPLTLNTPKPMLEVGDRPILETIIVRLVDQGFRKIAISVFHQAEQIKSYFGDGSRWSAEITYLEESKKLGTAGALYLLPEPADAQLKQHPLLVMNGDVLSRINFSSLLDFHISKESVATMGIRKYDFQIPYGVVDLDGFKVIDIREKPSEQYWVNAGVYALNWECLPLIEKDTYFDMPDLFKRVLAEKRQISSYPIGEYWADIGRPKELKQAISDYRENFE